MKEVYSKITALGVKVYLEEGVLKAKAPKGKICPDAIQLIKNNKEELIEYLTSKTVDKKVKRIDRSNNTERLYPLSFTQQSLWFIDKLHGGSAEYNMSVAYEIKPGLDIDLMKQVFNTIIKRHEVLRTVYVENDGEVNQYIRPMSEVNFEITFQDLSEYEEKQQAISNTIIAERNKAFDLAHDLMIRVSYVVSNQNKAVLVFSMHHIASDGWSIEVLAKEFFILYDAFRKGGGNPLQELRVQYVDYAHWQR
ncbi:condensation domain-containing protein, partial [Pseudoalteromonas luteoviolacea]|uniref:condensation domain-containing protein n=1 Tax=Pseudoalteromonas luteoviolacea TaxID=43657 RepID=UPI000A704074